MGCHIWLTLINTYISWLLALLSLLGLVLGHRGYNFSVPYTIVEILWMFKYMLPSYSIKNTLWNFHKLNHFFKFSHISDLNLQSARYLPACHAFALEWWPYIVYMIYHHGFNQGIREQKVTMLIPILDGNWPDLWSMNIIFGLHPCILFDIFDCHWTFGHMIAETLYYIICIAITGSIRFEV